MRSVEILIELHTETCVQSPFLKSLTRFQVKIASDISNLYKGFNLTIKYPYIVLMNKIYHMVTSVMKFNSSISLLYRHT